MRMTRWSAALAVAVGLTLCAWIPAGAKEEGRGAGRANTTQEHVRSAGERVANETVDAVADELTGSESDTTNEGLPPGLAKQGKTPPGLAKQGKTPPGWEHGKQAGWKTEQPKKESFLRRVIHGLFGKKSAEAPEEGAAP